MNRDVCGRGECEGKALPDLEEKCEALSGVGN